MIAVQGCNLRQIVRSLCGCIGLAWELWIPDKSIRE